MTPQPATGRVSGRATSRDAAVPADSTHEAGVSTSLTTSRGGRAGNERLVRIEDPRALFVPERYLASAVPLPLYLLELAPGSVKSDYVRTKTGVVAHEGDRIRRRTIRYPGGVRCDVEVHGDQVRGLPTTFDYDYFLALCRIADEGGVDRDGFFLEPGYRAVLRAAGRSDGAIGGDHVEAVKRAFARFAGLSIHTRLEVDFGALGTQVRAGSRAPLVPDGVPALREREGRHWVLEYDIESERRRGMSYDAIERLRVNPLWLDQTAAGIAAWMDVELHNSLRSGYAKRLLQLFTVRAARGWRVFEPWVLPLRELFALIEVPESQWGKTQTRAGIATALDTLTHQGVLNGAEVVKQRKGMYEVRLAAGERLLAAGFRRGTGALDSLADRMLLWHLRAVGFSSTQARELIRQRPDQVRTVLRRVHYLRTEKAGAANGRPIEDWPAWVKAAITEEWAFTDPDWQRWLSAQLAAHEEGAAPQLGRSEVRNLLAAVPNADADAAGTESGRASDGELASGAAAAQLLPEYPDDLWGRAVAAFVAERGDPRLYVSWLARTALHSLGEDTLEVTAEDEFVAEWVSRKYGRDLERLASGIAGRKLTVRVTSSRQRGSRSTAGAISSAEEGQSSDLSLSSGRSSSR